MTSDPVTSPNGLMSCQYATGKGGSWVKITLLPPQDATKTFAFVYHDGKGTGMINCEDLLAHCNHLKPSRFTVSEDCATITVHYEGAHKKKTMAHVLLNLTTRVSAAIDERRSAP